MTTRAILSRFWPLALVAVSGIAGATAVHQWKQKLRAEGAEEIHRQRADSALALADERALHVEHLTVARDTLTERLEATRARVDSVTARERRQRPEIVERIVHAPDTAAIRAAVVELEASHEVEVAGLRSALATADSLIAAERARGDALALEVRSLRDANASLQAAIGRDTSRGFLETWGERVLFGAGGAVIGYVVGSVVGG